MRRALLALALVGLVAGFAPQAWADPITYRTAVPLPAIELIPGGTIFTGALQDLKSVGYTEREFAVTITDPQVYSYIGESTETSVTPALGGPYKSRIIVRAPRNPDDFTGRVLVEMMNTTATIDLDIAWQQAHEYLMRAGWAYVGITVQQTGLNALSGFLRQPSRYTGLGLNLRTPAATTDPFGSRDPSLAWDLTSQVGALVSREGDTSPLRGYDVTGVYLTGQSQMAGYAVTYVNAVHPRAQVFDGFLVASRGTRATNLQFVPSANGVIPSTSTSIAQRQLKGGGTPVINLQTESDPIGARDGLDPAVWRADADDSTDRFRLWEVAGSSHNDRRGAEQALGILKRDSGLSFAPMCDWQAPAGVNDFPMSMAWNSALEALARWHEEGIAPAIADRIERSNGDVARDSRRNALGGLRLPRIDVPVATYSPESTGGLFCNLTGGQQPFPPATLKGMYPTKREYARDVRKSARTDVAEGFLLPDDAALLVASARRGPAADGRTIREYH